MLDKHPIDHSTKRILPETVGKYQRKAPKGCVAQFYNGCLIAVQVDASPRAKQGINVYQVYKDKDGKVIARTDLVHQLTSRCNALTMKNFSLGRENRKLTLQLEKLEKLLETSKKERQSPKEYFESAIWLKPKIERQSKNIVRMQNQIKHLGHLNAKLNERNRRLAKEVANTKNLLKEKLRMLSMKVEQERKIENLEKELKKLRGALPKEKAAVRNLSEACARLPKLEKKSRSLEVENRRLRAELKSSAKTAQKFKLILAEIEKKLSS